MTLAPEGSAASRAELVIVTPPPFTYLAIEAPSPRARIIYDAERQTIYGANQLDQQIERFVYADGGWSSRPPWSVPLLTDIALTPDGRSLIAVDQGALNEISLTDDVPVPVQRATIPPSSPVCGNAFGQAGAANNGKIFVVSELTMCTGEAPSYLYDLLDHSLRAVAETDGGRLAGSADGSRIYAGSNGSSPPPSLVVYDSLSNTAFSSATNDNVIDMTVSGDASRMILEDASVYDRSLMPIGQVPRHGVALASRDSRRAFMYVLDSNSTHAHLEIYDLTAPLDGQGFYPLIRTVTLPDTADNPNDHVIAPFTMTSSLDDAAVFLSGDSKLLVVPVN